MRIRKRSTGSGSCQQLPAISCALFTYIIDAQQAIAGLDATRLVDGPVQPHVRHDQRIVGTATQCQAQATALPLHGDLCQFRGNVQTILGNCCNNTEQKISIYRQAYRSSTYCIRAASTRSPQWLAPRRLHWRTTC